MTFDMAKLETELTLDEGVRFNVYTDTTGNPTVGIGHNLNAGPLPGQTYPMTQAQVDALFAKDVASTVAKLDQHLPWWRSLDDVRQRVMLNMCFNLGIAGLMTFVGFLSLVKTGQYAHAAEDMATTLWARQVGLRAVRIEVMMRNGTPVPAAPKPATVPAPIPAPPIPAPQLNPLEKAQMFGTILSLIFRLAPAVSAVEPDFAKDLETIASNPEGQEKLKAFVAAIEDIAAVAKALII